MDGIGGVILGTLLYGTAKVLGYRWWCSVGLAWLRPDLGAEALRRRSWELGMTRLLIGFGVGIPMAALHAMVLELTGVQALAYLLVYVPIRWFEWGLIVPLMPAGKLSWGQLWRGQHRTERRWRLIGIAVSCALDMVFLLGVLNGIRGMGRIFC
ncbi:hypothetical protein [Chitinibacter tainanensis]|uniref:hypothetical protein n=1 Tax=Chitinibacter tainanensis TaxID=230667 RepID=UPI00235322DD|nr:hypothetical protein [Chitinibacter tainanensis]